MAEEEIEGEIERADLLEENVQLAIANIENTKGRFPFSQNFRNFRFGGKWNTFRRFVPLKNSQKKWKI